MIQRTRSGGIGKKPELRCPRVSFSSTVQCLALIGIETEERTAGHVARCPAVPSLTLPAPSEAAYHAGIAGP